MIYKIAVQLNLPNNINLPYMGSILHGVLMDYLSNDIASSLHHNFAYSPLKQRVFYFEDKKIWEIVSMSEELFNELVNLFNKENKIYLKHYKSTVSIEKYSVEKISIQKLIDTFLHKRDLSRYIKINVSTPMSFKLNNQYMIFPNVKRFFRSIMIQFDAFFESHKLYDKETLEFLEQNVNIVNYKLKSVRFHMEKVKIPSFKGEIVFKINGPLPFLQLVYFLLAFGEFSGTGIKTSLGMGKYNIVDKNQDN